MDPLNIRKWEIVVLLVMLLTAQATMAFANADFSISASPSSISLAQAASSSSTIMVTSQGSFSDAVALSYSWFGDAPSDVAVNLPGSVTPPPDGSARAEIQISAGSSATIGVFTLRVTGTSVGVESSLAHNTDIAVTVSTAETATSTVTLTQVNYSLGLRIIAENLGIIIVIALIILALSLVAHVLLHLPPRYPTHYLAPNPYPGICVRLFQVKSHFLLAFVWGQFGIRLRHGACN